MPAPGDRHVLAAAIRAEADIIVTANLNDLPASSLAPHGLEAEHPDAFLVRLCARWPARFVESFHRVRSRLRHPPLTPNEHFRALRRSGLRADGRGARRANCVVVVARHEERKNNVRPAAAATQGSARAATKPDQPHPGAASQRPGRAWGS